MVKGATAEVCSAKDGAAQALQGCIHGRPQQ